MTRTARIPLVSLFTLVGSAAALLVLFSINTVAQIGTITVNTASDADANDGFCSIREALIAVNTSAVYRECPTGNVIQFSGNLDITVNATPLPPLTRDGIIINAGAFEVILRGALGVGDGLTITSANNIVRGLSIVEFSGNGIVLSGSGAQNNRIDDCYIGMTASASDADAFLGNQQSGILITGGANNNIIGSTVTARRNRIGFNNAHGIYITGVGTNDNVIQGNNIGLSLNTTTVRPNTLDGINIDGGARNNLIGGTGNGQYNIIGNNTVGVNISGIGTNSNRIINNRIGVDFTSGNPPATNNQGVIIAAGARNNVVQQNIISTSVSEGVRINGVGTNNNIVRENIISLNGGVGISIDGGASGTRIDTNNRIRQNSAGGILIANGSNTRIATNVIRANTGNGITILSGINNRITTNRIYENTLLGIDLSGDGVTPNDLNDTDTGPNNLQNFANLQFAVDNGANTFLIGTLNSPASGRPYTLEAFSVAVPDPTHGEGQTYIGSSIASIGTTPRILGTFASGLTGTLTSTITDIFGNTSEFSNNVVVEQLSAAFVANPTSGNASLTVAFTNLSVGNIGSYTWDFGDGSATSSAVNPTHIYTTPGVYTVTLIVRHISGLVTATASTTISVVGFVPTATFTNTITFTPQPTATGTPRPTDTLRPTSTATDTSTPRPTSTLRPTSTATDTSTPRPTNTLRPTSTATDTSTPRPTNTLRPTSTATDTNTPRPTVTSTLPPTETNTAQPSSTPRPTITPSNTRIPPDLDVDKRPIDDDTFVIVIENEGGDAENVIVEERLREGVVYVSSIPGNPICTERAGVILCVLGTVLGGTSVTIDINVNTDGTDITSGETIVRALGQTVVIDEPYISKASRPPFASPGAQVDYTITVINPTDRIFNNVRVVDNLPQPITIANVSATDGTINVSGKNITFAIAQLQPRQRITILLSGILNSDVTAREIVNRACLTYAGSRNERCAVSGFFRATVLPATGESQRPVQILAFLLVFSAIGVAVYARYCLKRR